jgi:hypothetical protein
VIERNMAVTIAAVANYCGEEGGSPDAPVEGVEINA